ncbi:10660_t:CDS:2, partial [Cetraspora pellucida]
MNLLELLKLAKKKDELLTVQQYQPHQIPPHDKVDNTIRYCKICVKELEGSQQSPYPYTKSGGSMGNLIQHLRDKHNIMTKNYKNYLDSEKK